MKRYGPAGLHRQIAELRELLVLAVPIIVSQLGQIGMNTADTIMVGPLGATPLAAAGLGSAIHQFAITVCVGVLVGMTPLVSQAFGATDRTACRRLLVQGCWIALGLSVPVVAMSIAGREISLLLGQGAEVSMLTGSYLRALAPSVPAVFLFMAYRQYLEGMGIAKPAMIFTFAGLALNVIANRVLIYGVEGWIPPLGLVGSGYATTIVRWTMLAGIVAYAAANPALRPFAGMRLRPDFTLLRRIILLGVPIGLQFGLEVGLFTLAAVMMGWMGAIELASHQVTINIAATTFMVALGVSLAGSIHVGQNVGAGRPAAVHQAVVATYILAVGFMAACALLFVAMPRTLIGLYTNDSAILELGSRLLLVAALFQVFDGAQVAGVSVLRGIGDTRIPMLIAAVGYWGFGMPVGYWLGFRTGYGPTGVWIGLSAGLAAVGVLLAFRVYAKLWRAPLPPPLVHDYGSV